MSVKRLMLYALSVILMPVTAAGALAADADIKVTEYTYYFAEDTVNSAGAVNDGEVRELAISSTPQYFYIDTVEADAIKSITLRSGYETNSAVTFVYTLDNDGKAVTAEQLQGFIVDNSELNMICSIADQKTRDWGYRTVEFTSAGVNKTEGDNYVVLDSSSGLSLENIKGKKAIIVGITGDIGSKAYFDNLKITYSREVNAPVPDIETIRGNGVKEHSVIVNKTDRTITVPVVPGTDTENLDAEVIIDEPAEAELTDGTWKNGIVTVKWGDEEEKWSVSCVEYGNPVLDGFYADPNIACFGGKYYIYPTTDGGTGWDAPYLKCFSSYDLVNWTDEGIILDLKDVSWSNGYNGWAPTIAEKDGKYYYYYSAAPKDNGPKNLAVAVADSPTGPFEDMGVIVDGKDYIGKAQAIDSAVFIDDDGQAYLYWGNGRMYMAKLSEDMLSIDGEIREITPSNFREAVFVIKHNGIYYFMWSDNDTGEPTYEVHYGTSDSPYGPINGDTTILSYRNADDPRIKATGHHSVLNIPGTDDWYICYHRFNIPLYGDITSKNSAAGNHREVCIDKMEFNENGSIKPVTATISGITEPVKAKAASFAKCELDDGEIKFELNVNEDIKADIYTAVYDKGGSLLRLFKNEKSGNIPVNNEVVYTVKLMVWEKDGMKPLEEVESKVVCNLGE